MPAFTFCCYEFDKVKYKPKKKHKDDPEPKERMVTRRQLTGCHLNGLVMLDIDHVENPMGVWERLQQQEELMKRVVLVHLTSSGQGIRIIFTADITLGNLADNQIVLAEQLGYTADDSCIDATRNSFAPKAEEMLCKRCAYHGLNYSAPYIVMRHWDQMHEDGNYWCGDITVDDKDWKLCELLTNIHHACQIHYFLGMAENYFDNQLAEAASTKTHRLKTVEGFNKLPNEFTVEDVMRCFNLKWEAARTKVKRLMSDHIVEKTGEYVENGTTKAKYTKIGILL